MGMKTYPSLFKIETHSWMNRNVCFTLIPKVCWKKIRSKPKNLWGKIWEKDYISILQVVIAYMTLYPKHSPLQSPWRFIHWKKFVSKVYRPLLEEYSVKTVIEPGTRIRKKTVTRITNAVPGPQYLVTQSHNCSEVLGNWIKVLDHHNGHYTAKDNKTLTERMHYSFSTLLKIVWMIRFNSYYSFALLPRRR